MKRSHPQRVYVAFEGGGAKGIAHVGALRALEAARDRGDLELGGFAGTSAGAIVAALTSVGWTSTELISAPDRKSVLTMLHDRKAPGLRGTQATDLLGQAGWVRLKAMRDGWRFGRDNWLAGSLLAGLAAPLLWWSVAGSLWTFGWAVLLVLLACGGLVWHLLRLRGLASLDGFAQARYRGD